MSVSDLEAWPGIEPGYTDLQSVTSPLRHQAISSAGLPDPARRSNAFGRIA